MENNPNKYKNLWIGAGGLFVAWILFQVFSEPSDSLNAQKEISYSKFYEAAQNKQVDEVQILDNIVKGRMKSGETFTTQVPYERSLADMLTLQGTQVKASSPEGRNSFLNFLIQVFISILPVLLIIFLFRQMQGGAGKAMGFGRSKAKLLNENKKKVTFSDVAGAEEAKHEVEEVVDFLKDPKKFQRLGGRIPRGVLLVGPPGTGKTLLAKAIAGEADVPFFSISGSDFVEMFVGVGASRVRDMFAQGKKHTPCIIFIDEIDAVGRHRGAGLGGGNDEREQTLNQLLVEMDGFDENESIILIAATNRPDVLDPALLRPGRFDRQVVVPLPDVKGREEILSVHLKKVPIASGVIPKTIARGTPGFSGADLANLVNEAALMAARRNKRVVSMEVLEEAKDKVMMGSERRSMVMKDEEKKLTAYHEGGHALVGLHLPDSDPIHKATIIPRGRALGMVMRLPEGDRISMSKAQLEADLAVAMGGRIAEEMIFGPSKVTTGASSDIKYATDIARRMVTEWGMSERLGPLAYGENQQEVFLGHSVTQTQNISESTSQVIDQEVRKIIDSAYEVARHILETHKDQLEAIAQGLLEFETLSGDEIQNLLEGKPLARESKDALAKKPKRKTSLPEIDSSSSKKKKTEGSKSEKDKD